MKSLTFYFALKINGLYFVRVMGHTKQMRLHIKTAQFEEASRALHSLKGLAATMGATSLASLASSSEKQLLNRASQEEGGLLIEQICDAIASTIVELDAVSLRLQSNT